MATKAKIGVLGASGYTGGELVRVLLRHPRAEIVLLTAERSAGKAMLNEQPLPLIGTRVDGAKHAAYMPRP